MIDLEELSKEELLELIKAMNVKDGEKPYHEDSIIAMAMADPKEARAISWRIKHPASRILICVFLSVFFLAFCFILFVVLSSL